MPSQLAGRGREALLVERDGPVGPPRGLGVIERPTRRAGRGQENLPDGREGSGGPPRGWEGSRVSPRLTGIVGRGQ